MSHPGRIFRAAIERFGDAFTVDGVVRRGLFAPLPSDAAAMLLDGATLEALPRPLWVLYLPTDDPTSGGDTLTWAGHDLAVAAVMVLRWRDDPVVRIALAA